MDLKTSLIQQNILNRHFLQGTFDTLFNISIVPV